MERPARVLPPPPPVDVKVFGLGAKATLAFVVERRRRQDLAAAEELRGVAAFADANRVDETDPFSVRAIEPELGEAYDGPLLGREGELRLAGQGAFGSVSSRCVSSPRHSGSPGSRLGPTSGRPSSCATGSCGSGCG